jgi:hypothetical protein
VLHLKRRLGVLFSAVVGVGILWPSVSIADAGRWLRKCEPARATPAPTGCAVELPPTTFQVGDDPADLKVKVVGDRLNRLELYFSDEVRTLVVDRGSSHLNCYGRLGFAPKSDNGAFSVRFGPADESAQLFGWQKGGTGGAVTLTPSPKVTLKVGAPVVVEWMSVRIARIYPAWAPDLVLIVRFSNQANVPWQKFNETSQSWETWN